MGIDDLQLKKDKIMEKEENVIGKKGRKKLNRKQIEVAGFNSDIK